MNPITFVANRYLLARSSRSRLFVAFSLIGVSLAVMALIVVTSVMNGFRDDLVGRVIGLNGHLSVYGPRDALESEDLASSLRGVAGVTQVRLVKESQGLVRNVAGMSPVLVRSTSARDLEAESRLRDAVIDGALSKTAEGGVAIGSLLADRFGLSAGDPLPVIVPDGLVTPAGVFPRTIEVPIAAVFRMGMYDVDSMLVFGDRELVPELFGMSTRIKLDVLIANPERSDSVAQDVSVILSHAFTVRTWQEEHAGLIGALAIERNVMFLILSLIVLIVALNILSGLTTMARDRRRDIALMQIMGSSRADVLLVFLITGGTIGVVGVVLGIAIGVPVAHNISWLKDAIEHMSGASLVPTEVYLFNKLPSRVDAVEVATIAASTLVATLLAALPSALRATTYDPAEVLRNG